MERNWPRLGEKLKAARADMEQQEAAARIGVKRGALRNIEQGKIAKVTPTVLAYARLVGWTEDSVNRVLDGGEPVMADAGPEVAISEAPAAEVSDLSLRVRQALREGPLIESRVTEVTTPSGQVTATIVVRGEEGTPPEELLAVLRSLKIAVTVGPG
ncbi:helix-turn-helix transcriptional regulator [Actinacidiphila sp. DG2A-62]|uniref:helix-turn-helix transcriptional regulator n=1 Tax=Actinacidiphila sp. DG2A-62 TaxID=3108821 RepID=UPI002DB594EA|nr:helix-turn-helix transcriptional regulator [Actinacidiphila sp. DG2A-62]MEC3995251.1 helix-turn-helix transcriptional regulator [Actinacidiphila sp. DG2A-62]